MCQASASKTGKILDPHRLAVGTDLDARDGDISRAGSKGHGGKSQKTSYDFTR